MDGVAAASAEDGGAEPITGAAEPAARTVKPVTETQVLPSTSGLCAEDASELEEMFCCDDCGEVFNEEAVFKEHMQHHQENRAGPDELDTSTVTENQGEPTNFCSVCSLSFAEASEFRSHMEQSHGPPPEAPAISPVKNFQCPDCGKSYHKYGFLLNHMRLHDQAPKSMIYDLEHLKTKSFNCETCGRSYSRASALDAHRRCHETNLFKSKPKVSRGKTPNLDSTAEEKPDVDLKHKKAKEANTDDDTTFECTCGKSFSSQMGLKTHQRFSQNAQCSPEEKPIKTSPDSTLYCADCKKFYKTKVAFLNHQRWHEKSADPTKRFTCEECGKTFVLLENYFRHQRRHDIPEKSFQHQVCQLQKKQLECSHCGLKFSRASAFQSHQLQHTVDVDPEPLSTTPAALLSVVRAFKFEDPAKSQEEKCLTSSSAVEADAVMVESDDDLQSYDPADLNVEVISASDSEDDAAQDLNPDLELQCESDQEGKEGCEAHALASKQGMDLNIVQVDFELAKERCSDGAGAESEPSAGRYECPDCHRCFARQVSLRVHRTWHRMYKKRGQTQGQSETDDTHDTAHCSLVEQHLDANLSSDVIDRDQLESRSLICNLCGKIFSRVSALVAHQLNHPKRKPYQCSGCMMSYSHEAALFKHLSSCSARQRDATLANKKEYNPTKTLLGPKIYHCEECGKGFWSLGAYSHHKQNPKQCADLRLRKGVSGSLSVNGSRSSMNVACPVCGRKFRHRGILSLHMRKHETGTHKCELCDRTFRLFSSLLRHQVVHSSQLPPPIKSFQHQVEQVKKNTYSCPDCGKLFSREKALQFHMKSHGYETGYSPSSPGSSVTLEDLQCGTCQTHFKSKSLLRAHRKVCVKRKRKVVDGADSLKSPDVSMDAGAEEIPPNPTLHCYLQYKHTAAMKYKCSQCDKSFPVVGALNLHKRIHARTRKFLAKAKAPSVASRPDERPPSEGSLRCQECGRAFVTNTALSSHQRWHAEKARSKLDSQTDANMNLKRGDALESCFSCPQCDQQFGQNSLLVAHMGEFHSKAAELDPEKGDVDSTPKAHQCPFCSASFAKVRGLRAHKWQAHAAELKSLKEKPPTTAPPEALAQMIEAEVAPDSSPVCVPAKETSVVGEKQDEKEKSTTSDPPPVKYATGLDSRKQSEFVHVNNFGLDFMSQENQLPEATSGVSSPTSWVSEHTVKCFFKCANCGKGFQTEEHLRTHKVKAKSKPHCCALCCQSFWTGNQLQQHLAWHDEVRCRLPNEVRFRLSAALSSSSIKPSVLMGDRKGCRNEHSQRAPESS
ncbi:zinc finger protein 729 [Synchiropus splendidus]|uniref:zinc finger protein 729 n=1 Tax=Synchiropus splendidus TaxID=270530 RepID=UPI00237D9FDC|nr:zinc finger protein 729 [Synchiropus splendidus]